MPDKKLGTLAIYPNSRGLRIRKSVQGMGLEKIAKAFRELLSDLSSSLSDIPHTCTSEPMIGAHSIAEQIMYFEDLAQDVLTPAILQDLRKRYRVTYP